MLLHMTEFKINLQRPGGVLVSKGEHMGSPLCHAAFDIRNNKMETAFRLVQRKFNVDLQNFQIWEHKTQRTVHLSMTVNNPSYFTMVDMLDNPPNAAS